MMPTDGARLVRGWRAEARAAQATLMTQAALNSDPEAAALASHLIGRCAAMIVLPENSNGSDPA